MQTVIRPETSMRFNQSPLFKNPATLDATFTFFINNTHHISGINFYRRH
jgi:hypothetical protein